MSLKEICYFQCIYLPAWAIPFTPGNDSEIIAETSHRYRHLHFADTMR